jgi:hypothetical protein
MNDPNSPYGIPGINPNPTYDLDPTDYRRALGYNPWAAVLATLGGGLQQLGAGIATAPRGQAIGQGLLGFLQGTTAGREGYENGLLSRLRWRELAQEQARQDALKKSLAPLAETPPSDAGLPYNAALARVTVAAGANNPSANPAGVALTEDEIDRMPLSQLVQIDPAQLTPEQYWAVSRRLFREGH